MSTVASPPYSDAIVVMGVSSCGKTTIGAALAARLGVDFIEGDSLHGAANVAKMSAGFALTDADRWPWLAHVGEALRGEACRVASCSALKRAYRDAIILSAGKPVRFVHLHGATHVLQQRIAGRKGHFMPASLLDSQLATLEMPGEGEDAVTIDIDQPASDIVAAAFNFLKGASR